MMVQAYSQVGLNDPVKAVAAQEIVTEERPKAGTFADLAVLAYRPARPARATWRARRRSSSPTRTTARR